MIEKQAEGRPWLSRATWATGLAFLLLGGAGLLLSVAAPHPPGAATLSRIAQTLLVGDVAELKPEPRESFVYVLLTLLSPLLVGASALAARRWVPPGQGRFDPFIVAAAVAVAAWVVVSDPASLSFRTSLPIGSLLVVAAMAVGAADLRIEGRVRATAIAATVAAAAGVALLTASGWRDARTIHAPALHFEAFAYSIVAAAKGRTCLVDLPTQYGCYGEFYAPILRLIGPSTANVSTLTCLLSALAVGAAAVFAARTLRSPLFAAGAVLALSICVLRPIYGAADVYDQYMPLRVLAPALSLLAILAWDARPRPSTAALLGAGAALALFWNLDAGVPVAGALGLYVVAASTSGVSRARLVAGATFLVGLLGTGALLLAGLAVGGRGPPDLLTTWDYHRIFVQSGFYMLPMPAAPAAWTICAALAAAALVRFAMGVVEDGPERRARDHAAFVAVLATGLFSYYVGRSHPSVLGSAAWPFVLLAFLLLDMTATAARPLRVGGRLVGAMIVLLLLAAVIRAAPLIGRLAAAPFASPAADPTAEDIAFVRSRTQAGAPLALLASKQAVILGELGRASALPGAGWAEVLTRDDADALFTHLVKAGPRDVFVSADLIWNTRDLTDLRPWVAERLPRLNPVYTVTEWGPGGRLLHFVRKPGPQATGPAGRPVQPVASKASPA